MVMNDRSVNQKRNIPDTILTNIPPWATIGPLVTRDGMLVGMVFSVGSAHAILIEIKRMNKFISAILDLPSSLHHGYLVLIRLCECICHPL